MSLKLVSSSFTVINLSLDGSRKISIKGDNVETEPSTLDLYAKRNTLEGCNREITACNLLEFVAKYCVIKEEIRKRKKEVIVRAFPTVFSDPKGVQYALFCKYQLIKYKPWNNEISNAWDNEDISEEMFCEKWNSFLQTELGQQLVPDWRRHLTNAEIYFSTENSVNDNLEEVNYENQCSREEWMYLSELNVNNQVNETDSTVDVDYWSQCHEKFTQEEINSMPTWLSTAKGSCESSTEEYLDIDINTLNSSQRKAYDIVENHFKCDSENQEQLLMIIKGGAGCGKSYLIDALRSLLRECCIVTAFFGMASFNVKGKTLHSILRLPIRGKYRNSLKGPALLKLQEAMNGIKYLIIDEFSVVGQNMLGWIDKRCRQATGRSDLPFGGISVFLVGDIGQLPPVLDKVLYHKKPNEEIETEGFIIYRLFDKVIVLTKNERSRGESREQQRFRQLLLNIRNGTVTEDDWVLLQTRTPDSVGNNMDTKEYVKLSFSNEKVANDNFEALKSLNVPIAQVNARHNSSSAAKLSSDDMGGLEPKLFLAVGARVMITRNLWTEKGLCNGSMGTISDVVYKQGDKPPALPVAVIIQFDETYTGPSFSSDKPRCVPIPAQINESDLYGSSHERQQLPVKLSWAITIHKSQDLTFDKA